jgi:hypothetical protein
MDMLRQLMTEGDGLSMLKMSETRGKCVNVCACLLHECSLQVDDRPNDRPYLITKVKPEVSGNLIIAATPRAKFAA